MFYVYDTILSRRNTGYVLRGGFIRSPGDTKFCFVIDSDDFKMELVHGENLDKAVEYIGDMFFMQCYRKNKRGVEVWKGMSMKLIGKCLCESGIELDVKCNKVTACGKCIDLLDEVGREVVTDLKYVFAGKMDGIVFLCGMAIGAWAGFDYVVFAFSQGTGKYLGLFEDIGFSTSSCDKDLDGYVAKHIMLNPCFGETWFSKLKR